MIGHPSVSTDLQTVQTPANEIQPGKIAFIIVMDGVRQDFFNDEIWPNVFEKLVPNGVLFTSAVTTSPAITTVAHVSMITGTYPNITGAVATSTYNATAYHLDGSKDRVSFGGETSIPSETLLSHADDVLTIMVVGKSKLACMKKGLNETKGSYYAVLPNYYQDVTIIDDEGEERNLDVYSELFPVSMRLQQDSWIINETMSKILYYKDQIKNGRDTLVVLNLPSPDWAGHAHGVFTDAYHPNATVYRQMVENIDNQIGRLIAFLETNGLADTSSFFITADHGFHNVLPGSWGLRPITSSSKATAFDVAMNSTFFYLENKTYQNYYIVASAENTLHLYLRYPEVMINKTLQFLNEHAIAEDFGSIPIFSDLWLRDDYKELVNDTSLYSGLLSDIGIYTETAGDVVIEYDVDAAPQGGFKPEFEDSLGDHGVAADLPIPMLMSGVGFEDNVTEEGYASITDIAPTVARLLGIKKPADANGKVWEKYFVDEAAITEVDLESLYLGEYTPTTVKISYETFGTGPYTVKYRVLDSEFNVIQQGDQAVTASSGNVEFTWEGGKFTGKPYYFVGQVLNSTGHVVDQAQDFVIIKSATTPEFPIVWILTFGVVAGVAVITVFTGRQMKKRT